MVNKIARFMNRKRPTELPPFRSTWQATVMQSLRPGFTFGKYQLGRELGAGGFGKVFLGRDLTYGRDVAIKFLLSEHTKNPDYIKRFTQEAAAAARIQHAGVVTIFESGQLTGTDTDADGCAFIVMERLAGEPLSSRLRRQRILTVEAAAQVTRQLASVLSAAHALGIVHRDLKPDNVFLVPDAELVTGERVKVLDFGIAKLSAGAGQPGATLGTSVLTIFGTPPYMSPEQCKSTARVDQRTDIYALGCMLYEMVCGRPPFTGDVNEVIGKQMFVEPPPPRQLSPTLPPAFEAVILRALAKEPGARYQTMEALRQALEPFVPQVSGQQQAVAAGHAPTLASISINSTMRSAAGERAPGTTRRPRLLLALGAAALAAGLAGIVVMASSGTKPGVEVVAGPTSSALVVQTFPEVDAGKIAPPVVVSSSAAASVSSAPVSKPASREHRPVAKPVEESKPVGTCDEVACAINPEQPCCKPRHPITTSSPERLATTEIRDGLRPINARVSACLHDVGTGIKVKFVIEADGHVSSALAAVPDAGVAACVEEAVKKARFRSFNGTPMTVTVPFHR
jgi:eukaryotic-like serine/threonine-protein kinase